MPGTVAHRELTETARVRFAVAWPADEAAIRQLLRDNAMPGPIQLTFEREPGYFRGANIAGGEDETIVAYSGGRIVCMGRCSRRDCWIDGRQVRAGYLAELRLDAAMRGRFDILRNGYRFFGNRRSQDSARLYFTSIGSENVRARRVLERGMPGLPAYSFLGGLATLLVAVPRRPGRPKIRIEPASPDRIPEMVRLLNSHARHHHLAAVWTETALRDLERHGLPLSDFQIACDGDRIVACGAFWDQRGFRQTGIRGYSPALSAMRGLVNLASPLLGTPRLPRPGSVLSHAFISPLAFEEGAEGLLPELVRAFFPRAAQRGVEYLTLALPENDPRLTAMRRHFALRVWHSRIYRVDWPGENRLNLNISGTFLPDLALL